MLTFMEEYDESKWVHYEGGISEFVSGKKFLCDDARPRAIINNVVVSSPCMPSPRVRARSCSAWP